MALALFLAAPKLGEPATRIGLVLLFASLVVPIAHLPRIRTAPTITKKRLRLLACLAAEGILVAGFGWWVWPEPLERKLSDGQMASLRNILAEHPGAIEIAAPMQDMEADRYAEQFDAAFRRANWRVQGVDSLWESRPAVGISVRYKKNSEQTADFIISALQEIGLKPDKALIPTNPSTANSSGLIAATGQKALGGIVHCGRHVFVFEVRRVD
ncbi:MAG TPA: hypothetical protein VKQ28_15010 [Candidatus Acidoferrum sp.]|nr:hypothetical protein [Candidatus Acidoferrum sp.]